MSESIHQRAVVGLAILSVNKQTTRQQYLDLFVPFVIDRVMDAPQRTVSLPWIQNAIYEEYGLHIPQGALGKILRRAKYKGYLKIRHDTYSVASDKADALDLSQTRSSVGRQYEGLITKFIDFCSTRSDLDLNREQAESILFSYVRGKVAPILARILNGDSQKEGDLNTEDKEFLVHSFIWHIAKRDEQGFEFLETVVKGCMLSYVLHLDDPNDVHADYEETDIVFDTPFILPALGLNGESMQAPRLELIDLLQKSGADLHYYEHTADEIRGILKASAHAIRMGNAESRGSYDVTEYFLREGWSAGRIDLHAERIARSLEEIGLTKKKLPLLVGTPNLDEGKLEEKLRSELQYQNEAALYHDLQAIVATHRLRKGRAPNHIDSCGALFITMNRKLARICDRYFQENVYMRSGVISPCMVDYDLTTLTWIKQPLSANDLPQKQIIADCYAAMQPPDELWQKYLDEIHQLEEEGEITPEEYYALRFSKEAQEVLSDMTRNNPTAYVEGTVQEVLERYNDAQKEELREKWEEEKSARKREAAEKEQLSKEIARAKAEASDRDELHEKLQQAEIDRTTVQQEKKAQQKSILSRARFVGSCVEKGVNGSLVFIVGAGLSYLLLMAIPQFSKWIEWSLILFCLVVVYGLTAWGHLAKVRYLGKRTGNYIETWITNFFLQADPKEVRDMFEKEG